MSKTAKIALATGGTVVFLLVSLSILVKMVVTPEKIRENLLPYVEASLQRKVDVGDIDIGFFSGVSLSDLRVQKKETPDDFVSVKLLALHYKLLPLFKGDLVIDQILLEDPRIEIVRTAADEFNFSDLLPSREQSQGAGSGGAAAQRSSAFDLLVNQIVISGGELHFVDRSQRSRSPDRYSFEQISFEASRITLDGPFPIEFSAMLNGSQIAAAGFYDIAKQAADIDLQLSALDLVQFEPYYRQVLPGKLASVAVSLNLEAQVKGDAIDSKGKLLFEKLDLALTDFPELALQQAKLEVDYAINYQFSQKRLALSTLLVQLNDTAIGAEGTVDLAGQEPRLALAVLFNRLDLRSLVDSLPEGVSKDLRRYRLAGVVDGRGDFSGSPREGVKLLKSAAIELTDVAASIETLRAAVTGQIRLDGQSLEAKQLQLDLGGQAAQLDFRAENMFGSLIRGDFKLAAKQFDLNPFLPEEKRPVGVGSEGTQQERKKTLAEDVGPFDLPLDIQGTLRVGKLLYRKLALDNVAADMILKDNHLRIEPLRSGVAGGEVILNSDVNLGVKGLSYQGQMIFDQSNLASLLAGVVPQAQQSVSGLLRWQNDFSGRGVVLDDLLKALQIKGFLQVSQGQVSGSPLLEQLALFLDLPDLKVLSFDALESRYDLRNGLAKLSGQLNSSKVKLNPVGTIGVDGGLDIKLDARLAPELVERLGVKTGLKQSLSDDSGWGILPLTIRGSLTSPKIGFDAEALQRQATEQVKREVTKRLLDKVAPADQEQVPVKQLLEGTLKRLFGN